MNREPTGTLGGNPAYLRKTRDRVVQVRFVGDRAVRCLFGEECGAGMHYSSDDTPLLLYSTEKEKFNQYLRNFDLENHAETESKTWKSSSVDLDFEDISIDELCLSVQDILKDFLVSNRVDRLFSTIKINVEDRTLIDRKGSIIEQRFMRILGEVVVIKSRGDIVSLQERCGGQVDIQHFLDQFEKTLPRANNRATLLLDAKRPKQEEESVILSPELTGLFVHETLGHAAEADTALAGSYLSKEKGRKIASEQITIVDDPVLPNGHGSHGFDDEGVPAVPTTIVEEGIFKNFLHTVRTASIMGDTPTSNARCWNYQYIPLVRMTNIYAEPGEWNLDELIEDTQNGYFLEGVRGVSQVTPSGDFVIKSILARPINHGEIKESPMRDVIICDSAKNFLQNVDAATSDFCMSPHLCFKEQLAKVGMGGPFVRTKAHIGEGV